MIQTSLKAHTAPPKPLTRVQRDLLALKSRGLSVDEISDALCVCRSAVTHGLSRAYRALGARNACEAVAMFQEAR